MIWPFRESVRQLRQWRGCLFEEVRQAAAKGQAVRALCHGDIASAGPAVFRLEGSGLDAELLDRAHRRSQPIHVPDMIAPAHLHQEPVHAHTPVVLLAAAHLEIVPGAFPVAALDMGQHHHDAERIPHATADSGDRQRNLVDQLLLHGGGNFSGFGLELWRFTRVVSGWQTLPAGWRSGRCGISDQA